MSWINTRLKFDFDFEFAINSFNITAEQAALFSINGIRLSKYQFVSPAQWWCIFTLEINLLCKNKAKILKFTDRSIWVQNATSCYCSIKIIVKKRGHGFYVVRKGYYCMGAVGGRRRNEANTENMTFENTWSLFLKISKEGFLCVKNRK